MIDVEIAPEPSEAERAVLAVFLTGSDEPMVDTSRASWARAALEEGTASEEGYGSAPLL